MQLHMQLRRHRMWTTLVGALAAVAVIGPVALQAQTSASEIAESVRDDLDAANVAGDFDKLEAVRVYLERGLVAHPDDPALLHYLGFVHYRIGSVSMDTDEDKASDYLETAQDVLEQARELHDWPETRAVLASVYGMRIGSNMIRGMTLGPKADNAMEEAYSLGADNPRVWLLDGASNLYKPRMFGGGVDKAMDRFTKALELFENDSPLAPHPKWGHAEAHVWIGMAHMKEKAYDDARASFEAALALEPNYAWVSEALIPALDRAASGS